MCTGLPKKRNYRNKKIEFTIFCYAVQFGYNKRKINLFFWRITGESESTKEEDSWLLEMSSTTEAEDEPSVNDEWSSSLIVSDDSSKLSDGVERAFCWWNLALGSESVPTSLFKSWSELWCWTPAPADVDSFLLIRGDVGVLFVLGVWLCDVEGRDSRFSSIITPSDSSASRNAFFRKPNHKTHTGFYNISTFCF